MPTLRHLLPVIALLLLLLLHPALHAATRTPQPVVTRIHLHHLVEYRSVTLLKAPTLTARHRSSDSTATLSAPQAQPNSFASMIRAFFSLSSHP